MSISISLNFDKIRIVAPVSSEKKVPSPRKWQYRRRHYPDVQLIAVRLLPYIGIELSVSIKYNDFIDDGAFSVVLYILNRRYYSEKV